MNIRSFEQDIVDGGHFILLWDIGDILFSQQLTVSILVNADGYQYTDIFYFSGPAALEPDAV